MALWCDAMTNSQRNLWLLIFSHIFGHIYVIYLTLSTVPTPSSTTYFFLVFVFAFPVVLFVYLRINGRLKQSRFDSNHSSSSEYKVEARSTEMDIEGPPRIPLRSALCPEMAGLLVQRYITENSIIFRFFPYSEYSDMTTTRHGSGQPLVHITTGNTFFCC